VVQADQTLGLGLSRRGFLIGALAAGGAGLGLWRLTAPHANPLKAWGEGTAITPYLQITPEAITVIVPRAEMGQGVQTTLAALVAEELDVTLDQITVVHGPAAPAYYNTAILEEGIPFAAIDDGTLARTVRGSLALPARLLGYQITGGSSSVPDAFDKMREAGALARETLKAAAARQSRVDASGLRTKAGLVLLPDGTARDYRALASEITAADEAAAPPLRPAASWRLLGHSQPRVDMAAKVTGAATYAIDVRLPGMLFAAVRLGPDLTTPLVSVETAAAEAMPGVRTVVPFDRGCAVLAATTWHAQRAAEALECTWEDAAYPAGTEAHFDAIAAAFDDTAEMTPRDDGDVDAAFAQGADFDAEYRVPYLAHATLEPMSIAAEFTDGRLTIWAGSQAPTTLVREAAKAAGIPPEAVTFHACYLGGGFGRRGEMDSVQIAAQIARALPGTPFLLTYQRREDMMHDAYRPAAIGRVRAKLTGGRLEALDLATASPSTTAGMVTRGAAPLNLPEAAPDGLIAQALWDQPYEVPHLRARAFRAPHLLPVGFWRSVGGSQNVFFQESALDEIAHQAGRDPLEMRLEMISHTPSRAVLQVASDMAGWRDARAEGRALGLAFAITFGVPTAAIVEVVERDSGLAVATVWVAADVGTLLDPRNAEAQLISGINMGLSAALGEAITLRAHLVEQENFDSYRVLRMDQAPTIHVRVLENGSRIRGIGEPGTPPAAPALANALFALTGIRARTLPLRDHFDFA
jgi:isoquinoline 1-oxidoreductase beta subunit